jgi:hypothetical protein
LVGGEARGCRRGGEKLLLLIETGSFIGAEGWIGGVPRRGFQKNSGFYNI